MVTEITDSVIEDGKFYEEMAYEYQETGSSIAFGKLYDSVKTYLGRLTKQQHKKVAGYGVTQDEVRQEVEIALWKTAEKFDGSQGSNFISYLKQRVSWRISDHIIRPINSKKNQANQETLSLDVVDTYGDTILDKETFESAGGNELELEIRDLVEQFKSYGTDAEHNVVKTVFDILLEKNNADKDVINKELYEEYPNITKGSVRAKKKRALEKFQEFVEIDGSDVNIDKLF